MTAGISETPPCGACLEPLGPLIYGTMKLKCPHCGVHQEVTTTWTPDYPMTEARARELLCGVIDDPVDHGYQYAEFVDIFGSAGGMRWAIHAYVNADELEAFAWWLRNKPGEEP